MDPTLTDERELGSLLAVAARKGKHPARIAKLLGLAEDEVRHRLGLGLGKRPVWRVFKEEWSGRDRGAVLTQRGSMSAAAARKENLAAAVARICGLSEAEVRARVVVASRRRIRTEFAVEWPPGMAARGRMTIAAAAEADPYLSYAIQAVTSLGWEEVDNRLSRAAPSTLVRDVFAAEWPEKYLAVDHTETSKETEDDEDDIGYYGRRRCAVVREANHAARIAKDLGFSEAVVRRRLDAASGRQLVRVVFAAEWPRKATVESRRISTERNGHAAQIASPRREAARTTKKQSVFLDGGRNPERMSPGQGSDVHRLLQDRIARLGQVRKSHVETDKQLFAGFRPDVAWFNSRSTGPNEQPYHVFEIERGSHQARAKSLQSLQAAHECFNADITLIVYAAHVDKVKEMVPAAIEGRLNICTIEDCLGCSEDSFGLVKVLRLDVGGRR